MYQHVSKWVAAAAALLVSASLHAQTVIADFSSDTGLHGQGDGSWLGYTTSFDGTAEHAYGPSLDGGVYYFTFASALDLSGLGTLDQLFVNLTQVEGNAATTLSITFYSGADWAGTATALFDLSSVQFMDFSTISSTLTLSGFDASNIQAFSVSSLDFDPTSALNLDLASLSVTAAVRPSPSPSAVPEPATNAVLIGSALMGLGAWRKRRQAQAKR